MKKQWLAALKEEAQWDDPAEDGGGAATTEWLLPTGSLRALVDEREALLEALKAAADKLLWANSSFMHSWAQERPCEHDAAEEASEGEAAARAAIAKAEAE